MSISIKDAKAITPFETFDISNFGVHVDSSIAINENNLNVWTISLLCVLDISKDESFPELVKVEMSDDCPCNDLIPTRTIILSPKKHRRDKETLWMITLEAILETASNVRIMNVEVNIETTRPRRKKTKTIAQPSVGG